MSRRRRETEEKPDLGFEIPDFDEAEFIRKETISFRTTLVLFLYSVVTALVTFLLWATAVESWLVSLVIAGATGYLLRYIYPALRVDISHFGKKEWTGTGFLYFFSWLAFFIFLTNPPLYDGVAPELDVHITPDGQEPGGIVNITLAGADNLGIDTNSIEFEVIASDGSVLARSGELTRHPGMHDVWSWERVFTETGTYTVRATVRDTGNALFFGAPHATTTEGQLTVGNALSVLFTNPTENRTGAFTASASRVEVHLPSAMEVYTAELVKTDGTRILLERDREVEREATQTYYAQAHFAGFARGNNTFHIEIREHDSYFLTAKYGVASPNAPLVSAQNYTVTIDDESLLGDHEPKPPSRRSAAPARAPGFDAALVVAGLVIAGLFVARRRNE